MGAGVLCAVIVLFFAAFTEVSSEGCSLPVRAADEKHMPVLLDNSTSKYEFIYPKKGNVLLNENQNIILLCPRNTLTLTNSDSSVISCVSDKIIKILNENQDFEKVVCSKGVKGATRGSNKKCGNNQGTIIEIGFPVDSGQFVTLISSCYDSQNGNALYSSHTLIGGETLYASKSNFRPSFSTEGLGPRVSADVSYKQTYQKATFSQLLGSAELASKYINPNSYLARGHLAPVADFLFASWQYATYFYINTVPQWQRINNCNWKRLENLVKDTGVYYNENFQIYTGSYQVLQLPDVNGNPTNIFLVSNTKLAAPRFMWKIVHSETSEKAIAFVVLNNPFAAKLETEDKICTDICSGYGWDRSAWKNGSKGFIYCCDARDLLNVIKTGPEINVRGVLNGPTVPEKFLDCL